MIPWVELASATAPGGGELKLMRRGSEFSITIDGSELMNSRRGGSESALGEIGCEQLAHAAAPRVLIGGLGMGFTLRAALGVLGPAASITVAELVPEIIDWAGGPLADVFQTSLHDPRVTVLQADVAAVINAARGEYDAILLDVDNGPDGLVALENDALYREGGLRSALRALTPAGVLAVWAASQNLGFKRRLTSAGFTVQEHARRSGASRRGARHLIWVAARTRPADGTRPAEVRN